VAELELRQLPKDFKGKATDLEDVVRPGAEGRI
jgi:hypothetical protein